MRSRVQEAWKRIKAQDLYWKILYRQLGSVDLVAIVLKKIVVKRDCPDLKSLNAIKSVYVIHFYRTAFIDTETYRVYCVV
jgi:hypothetical protein